MGDLSGGSNDKSQKSSSTTNTTTTNIDRRQVMSDGAIGITSDSSTVNVQQMDAGIVKSALDVVAGADATAGQGFTQLLTLADRLFTAGGSMLDKTANTTMAQVGALTEAQKTAAGGGIDQKTVFIGAGVLAAAYLLGKNK